MKNIHRGRLAILLTSGISTFLFVRHYANSDKTPASYDPIVEETPSQNNTKYILLYTSYFDFINWDRSKKTKGPDFFRSTKCPVTDCVITSRPDLLPSIDSFDALVFNAAERWPQPIPPLRSPSQLYVAAILESPAHTTHVLEKDGDFFNLTMTYRLDSDVPWSYGQLAEINGAVIGPSERALWLKSGFRNYANQTLLGLVRNKTKMAAQYVSHCGAISGRDKLVKEIQKSVQVDVFGNCGPMRCPLGSPRCSRMLTDDYRFYFAFENSLCRDYVTEKLFNAMDNYVIPVVFGGADYTKFVPPHSVINVQDFKTVKELVNRLKFLADNPEEYVKYFWWKKHYRVVRNLPFCELCRVLHGSGGKPRYYEDIRTWWYEDACQVKAKIEF
ncbi:alpha-(1,3)-fucosyltransferase C-like [Culex pipiens pallens]|uniref:alpha-(1,3)-fucosyltransferase C-like n=1 Tax=Culex pipiens pallens TaxID=42434 RepID=UPI00195403E2|nr:alpha-(1,3)-fucosyltransferase C-like [Culex pipiens pallens]